MTPAARLAEAITLRLDHLGLTVAEWARISGVSDATLRRMKRGDSDSFAVPKERAAERALGWAPGTMRAVRRGEAPSLVHEARAEPARATATAHDATVLAASGATPGMTDEQRAALVHDIAAEVVKLLREQGAQ